MRLEALRLQNASTKDPVRFVKWKTPNTFDIKVKPTGENKEHREQDDLQKMSLMKTYLSFEVVEMKMEWYH